MPTNQAKRKGGYVKCFVLPNRQLNAYLAFGLSYISISMVDLFVHSLVTFNMFTFTFCTNFNDTINDVIVLQPLRLDIKRRLTSRSDRVKCVDLHPTEPWMLCALYNGHVHVMNYDNQQLYKDFEVS